MEKKWTKIIEKFNKPETALVISAWPVEGKNAVNHGIAWYTKMTVSEMAKTQGKKFVVLAETNHDNKPKLVCNGKVLILRVFNNAHKSLYPKILRWLSPFTKIKKVYVHSEFGTNGGMLHFAMILPFLALIRLMGKRIVFYSHNVIADIATLGGHLNVAKWQTGLFNLAIRSYYKILSVLSEKIVVLDPALGNRLAKIIASKNVQSLNMPVEKKVRITKKEARRKLGYDLNKKMIMTFGFVSWYKGTDWLIENVPDSIQLVVAGGPSYSLRNKKYYKKYLSQVENNIQSKNNIEMTGFVPEEKIGLYMAATDMVVLPYRGMMGSSGSLSHALSYAKPFLMSQPMNELTKGMGLNSAKVVFPMSKSGMKTIESTLKNKKKIDELTKLSKRLAAERDLANLASTEYNELYAEDLV